MSESEERSDVVQKTAGRGFYNLADLRGLDTAKSKVEDILEIAREQDDRETTRQAMLVLAGLKNLQAIVLGIVASDESYEAKQLQQQAEALL